MKIMSLLFFCTLLSVSACQNSPSKNQTLSPTAPLSAQQFTDALTQHTWSYTPPNSSVPILVNISTQGTDIYSGCNQISKAHVLDGNHLQSKGTQIQTLMGCGTLESQENLATQIFTDAHLNIQTHAKDQKKLNVSLKNGTIYTFQALPYISDLKNYDAELLKKFTWQQLIEDQLVNSSQTLLMNFTTDRMLFYVGCNGQSQKYILENKALIPKGDFRSQVKFCGNNHHELHIAQAMSKPMNINFDYSTTFPKLILESKYQPNMIFQATPRKEDLKLP